MESYPFLIRRPHSKSARLQKVVAPTYHQALNVILNLQPNKFIKTKHARAMDLISAKVSAAERSRKEKIKMYIHVSNKDGECIVTAHESVGGYTPLHAYSKGSEISFGVEQEEKLKANKENLNIKQNKRMSKNKKAEAAKKPTSKTNGKSATTKASSNGARFPKQTGKNSTLTIKEIVALVRKGNAVYRQNDFAPLFLKYVEKMKDQTREVPVIIVKAEVAA